MSTHCGIAVKTEEGYNTIYCHFDGYPKYMFTLLTENYNSEELATKLVSLGDASYITERLEPTPGVTHTFDTPEEGVSVFYHRDRGEDWEHTKPAVYKTKQKLYSDYYYAYVFDKGRWVMVSKSGDEIEYGDI